MDFGISPSIDGRFFGGVPFSVFCSGFENNRKFVWVNSLGARYRIFQNHTQQITPEKNTPEKKTIDLDTPHNFLGKPMDFGISPFIDGRFFGGVPFSVFLFWV